MDNVTRLATATDWTGQMADMLESIARSLRDGTLSADQGVLVMRNGVNGRMHSPIRLGAPSSCSEAMGLMAYGQAHLFQIETQ